MNTVKINGMSCQHCVASVQQALEAIPGIANIVVDLEKNQAIYDGAVPSETVAQAITAIGFEVVE
ncbi:MAG: mercury transporter [Desulfobulbus propionicus]|nr:MAG: mercury transporter [Desulfobulbus propionicus]PIE64025.1 MAG: mercury transporter [Desulfobacterales bacterium]